MSNHRLYHSTSVAALLLLGACTDVPVSPDRGGLQVAFLPSGPQTNDPALVMRAGLRAIPDSVFARNVTHRNNLVIVGFKEEGGERGVSRDGRSLVPSENLTWMRDIVRGMAANIVYEFQDMPAVLARLNTAEDALNLRHLPWIDYVLTGGEAKVTADSVASCDTGGSPVGDPQIVGWHIGRVRADAAWPIATGNTGLNSDLVILDDGVDFQPPERKTSVRAWYVAATERDGEHGTLVIGAANAAQNDIGTVGVAPGAWARMNKIYDGATGPDPEIWAPTAIAEEDEFAEVISMSFSTKEWTSSNPPPSYAAFYDAILVGRNQHGVVFVASTGNQERSDWFAFPAAFPEVIGVGGSGPDDEYRFNNYAQGNVTLAAPATDVVTLCKGGAAVGTATGTSFATPMVAGAVMMLREVAPTASPTAIQNWLTSTAVPMADPQKSGAGRLDIYAALLAATQPPPPPPPDPCPGPDCPCPECWKPWVGVAKHTVAPIDSAAPRRAPNRHPLP